MDPKLAAFMQQIMNLDAGLSGMGGAQAGVVGSRSTETDIVNELRRNAHAFATAYIQKDKQSNSLIDCSQQLEGSLQSMRIISAVSEDTLAQLSNELHALTDNT